MRIDRNRLAAYVEAVRRAQMIHLQLQVDHYLYNEPKSEKGMRLHDAETRARRKWRHAKRRLMRYERKFLGL